MIKLTIYLAESPALQAGMNARGWRLVAMKRTNTFNLNPREEEAILREWADNCARMYNEINYKRRQSFFSSEFDWDTGDRAADNKEERRGVEVVLRTAKSV